MTVTLESRDGEPLMVLASCTVCCSSAARCEPGCGRWARVDDSRYTNANLGWAPWVLNDHSGRF